MNWRRGAHLIRLVVLAAALTCSVMAKVVHAAAICYFLGEPFSQGACFDGKECQEDGVWRATSLCS